MGDKDNFLARWSRRKRDAAPGWPEQSMPIINDEGGPVSDTATASFSSGRDRPSFDPASLPPIESIGAGSDIRAFLAAGVPADLTRAALRRVWLSDPAIRDFVGLSENSWDFNAPGAMAGFGPIDKKEVGQLLVQLLGEPDAAVVASPSQTDKAETQASESNSGEESQAIQGSTEQAPVGDQRPLDIAKTTEGVTQRPKAPAVSQYASASAEHRSPRAHGGALPK
jgi:hypothetical protein